MNLNREQFSAAVERGQALLDELKSDYSELELKAVFSNFNREKVQGTQRWNVTSGHVLSPHGEEECIGRKKAQRTQKEEVEEGLEPVELTMDLRVLALNFPEIFVFSNSIRPFRELLMDLQNHPQDAELEAEAVAVEKIFLHPAIEIYRGDVQIELCGNGVRDDVRKRLHRDARVLIEKGSSSEVRMSIGSLELLALNRL